ncbi:type II toxin-antitoxin system PemK/MazF family toxin [Parafilimonas terrae]|uniref:PemK-like, MazF-like toxin of type II toxin-antitoxin system n=1 Tax=Parafilimonas terrae TaxID=1465490 RepID=A0A1I5V2D9_9BACT|nr:type II toxin-antitoxin system PemK/MazF family toxin [Parafilimonas terrae]SFQ01658.1 PemK-like, MazF-like toxin of type II toxin-antitoxin system [Parafilimonas terrae]
MAIKQRDVYLLPFPFNNGTQPHPFIVLSTLKANNNEGTFIAVMITSSNHMDDFSFPLTDDMFEKKLHKLGCHVRMHLLTLYADDEIINSKINTMKPYFFKQLMAAIGDAVFNYDFKPLPEE